MFTKTVLLLAASGAAIAGPVARTFSTAPWYPNSIPSYQEGFSFPSIPQWTGGDKAACSSIPAAFSSFCQFGNPFVPFTPPTPTPTTSSGAPVCVDFYQEIYDNYTVVQNGQRVGAATVDNQNYITYLLVNSTDACLDACDNTKGCEFVNIYQLNPRSAAAVASLPAPAQAPYQKGALTCSLFRACSGTDKATNTGDVNGYITDSDAYCKRFGFCSPPSPF